MVTTYKQQLMHIKYNYKIHIANTTSNNSNNNNNYYNKSWKQKQNKVTKLTQHTNYVEMVITNLFSTY